MTKFQLLTIQWPHAVDCEKTLGKIVGVLQRTTEGDLTEQVRDAIKAHGCSRFLLSDLLEYLPSGTTEEMLDTILDKLGYEPANCGTCCMGEPADASVC